MFLPENIISPFFILHDFSNNLIIESAVSDFPLPDSPIRDTTSDFFISKLIFFKISSSLLDFILRHKFFILSKLFIIFISSRVKCISYNI